ncbi:MAG: hypothetical protein CVT66_03365 [Actinobacteria bacterium HGW-Actinobacteria-6]|jgi:uncharacterized protein YybS (DUF2232 family)|nr:MAG: hypothetical protein CVT66_03365 [Actinobacteria bacterium HGW-Actinobacteria-6]
MASAVADNVEPVRPVRLLAVSAACILGAYLSLAVPFLGVPVAAGALAWLWYRGQRVTTIAIAVLCGLLTFLIDPAGPFYVTLWLLIAGPLVATLVQRRSVATAVLVSTALMTVIWLGLLVGVSGLEGTSVNGYMSTLMKTATQPALDQVVGNATEAVQAREQIALLETTFVRLWPAIIAIMSFFTTLTTVFAVSAVARTSGVSVKIPPDLDRLDLSPHVVWGLIVGGGLLAADKFLGGWNGGVMGVVGENLLRITQWILFLQGVAVFASLYKRAKFSRLSKALGYVLLGLTEAFLPLVSLTGLADMFLNVRKLPRDGAAELAAPSENAPAGSSGEDRSAEE